MFEEFYLRISNYVYYTCNLIYLCGILLANSPTKQDKFQTWWTDLHKPKLWIMMNSSHNGKILSGSQTPVI